MSSPSRRRGGTRLVAVACATALLGTLQGPAAGDDGPRPRGTDQACPAADTAALRFVDAAGPFEAAIRCVAAYGITRGRTATTFEPLRTVTRGQLASFTRAMLDRALPDGLPTTDGTTPYRDVAADDVHAGAIGALSELDPPVLRGFDDGTFRPGQHVTRAQAATIVDRTLRAAAPDLDVPAAAACTFTDQDRIPPDHVGAVRRACALGIVAGRDDGRFDPSASLQRGASAALSARTLDVLTGHGELGGPLGVTTLASGLDQPWEVVRTDAGRTFVTERGGRLLELTGDGVTERRRFDVVQSGEGGLLGLAEAPDGSGDLFAYLTTDADNRVVRFDPDTDAAPSPVLTGIPAHVRHNGGRIAFGPDGMLYVGTGDVADNDPRPSPAQMVAQDLDSLAGKILRVAPDGSVPDDNPFDDEVWSLGHRNVQGLAWDAAGRLWASEFGPGSDDEINVVEAGGNYGWPEALGDESVPTDQGPSVPATFVAQPAEASWSGIAFTTEAVGFAGPGELLVAALRGERLWQLTTDGPTVTEDRQRLVGDLGRLRTVAPSGDGGVLVLTGTGDDRLVRIGP